MDAITVTQLEKQLPGLIADLGSNNGLTRRWARHQLVNIGKESIPSLLAALQSDNVHTRWEAAKALGELRDPQIASTLTTLLTDPDAGVRWAAADSLVRQGRSALYPLLERFIHNFDSPWLREGVRHILHVFKDRNMLTDEETAVFTALNKQTFLGFDDVWTDDATWAAERALEVLDQEMDTHK